jgi:hypothetical protein
VALALLSCGTLAAAEVVSALAGRPLRLVPYERVAAWASRTPWQDRTALAVAGVTAIVGALLLLIAVVPGRPRRLALRTGDPRLVAGVSRRTMAGTLATSAARVDGVSAARARIIGRQATITATTELADTSALATRIHAAAQSELARFSPVRPLSLRIRIRTAS